MPSLLSPTERNNQRSRSDSMAFLTGSSGNSWQPVMTADTTTPSYWLNWRVMLCIIWVLLSLIITSLLISKYEGPRKSRHRNRESQEEPAGLLYEDEVWKPCLKGIHPAWLLAFRVAAFFVLLSLLIANAAVDGGEIFYFYTQWTFSLITIYFGLGSLLSMYGCYQYHNKVGGDRTEDFDVEQGTNSNESNGEKHSESNQEHRVRQTAGFWGYIFQIVFQMNAGAVMLTDCVFWFIIVPFLAIKDYDLNFLIINMHTINAVFLLGDTALNCLRFPWWPYPFLDLSSTFAPLCGFDAYTMLWHFCEGMGIVDTKSIESIQASLSLFGQRSDHRKNRFISCDELERKKELEDLMKDMANYNVQLEGKGSACSSEIEKDISMNAEKLLIMETDLTAAIDTKLEALTQTELMETELQMEKRMTDERLRHVSELNEAVMHSKMASNEGEKEIRVVLVEKVTELALATTTVVEVEEKLEYMRKLLEVMQDLENQLINKFVFIDSLQLDLNQANELRGSFEKRASNAISELNTVKSKFKMQERKSSDQLGNIEFLEMELNQLRLELKNCKGRGGALGFGH
ncbi:unnamed protein product [Camellia sinensis]